LLNLNTIWRRKKNVTAISSSSAILALSNYTTCGQTQTGAKVPLRAPYSSKKPTIPTHGWMRHALVDIATLQRSATV
jgi:hypothetical protein